MTGKNIFRKLDGNFFIIKQERYLVGVSKSAKFHIEILFSKPGVKNTKMTCPKIRCYLHYRFSA